MAIWTGTIGSQPAGTKVSSTVMSSWHDALLALTDPWSSWTPVLTGSGSNPSGYTAVGNYIQLNKLVIGNFDITMSASVGTGNYSVSTPTTMATLTGVPVGASTLQDASASANRFFRSLYQNASTTLAFTAEDSTRVTNAVPFAFAVNDHIAGFFIYQSA